MSELANFSYQAENEISRHIVNTVDQSLREKECEIAQRLKKKRKIKPDRDASITRVLETGITAKDIESDNEATTELNNGGSHVSKDMPLSENKENVFCGGESFDVKGRDSFGLATGGTKKIVFSKFMKELQEVQQEELGNRVTLESVKDVQTIKNKKRQPPRVTTRAAAKAKQVQEEDDNQESDHSGISPCLRKVDSELDDVQSDEQDTTENDSDETPKQRKKRIQVPVFEEDEMGYERYFTDINRHSKSLTSNNTLGKLPMLSQSELIKASVNLSTKHEKEIDMLLMFHKRQFAQWHLELISGFNLLFYGYGSKKDLLEEFARTIVTNEPLLVVNGYFLSITIKKILRNIIEGVLKKQPRGSLEEQARHISDYFQNPKRKFNRLYLLINNIDGSQLRSERTYTCLSILASSPNIHVVASIDNINAGILFNNVLAARFNWVWHDLTTYQPYNVEMSFKNPFLARNGAELSPHRVLNVLSSLPPRARGVFQTLIKFQIEEAKEAGSSARPQDLGLELGALYNQCSSEFLVSSKVAFELQLKEICDHQIIKTSKRESGGQILYVPLDTAMLKLVLEKLRVE